MVAMIHYFLRRRCKTMISVNNEKYAYSKSHFSYLIDIRHGSILAGPVHLVLLIVAKFLQCPIAKVQHPFRCSHLYLYVFFVLDKISRRVDLIFQRYIHFGHLMDANFHFLTIESPETYD